ncbi:5'-nucleotidase, lipoprotein e(P4) family [Zooshikella marina]|uniref:5'-nucleotidase, lipoprotein e(P4) family n=1 Tax=Zooshikella ganghwensis TaxID=202772 RepID=UPI001BAFDD36|nr:5'-nucleotidase, lipoprotein e(P4) family [Zooshikella ganghwensis]MBU2707827.1 5'-nucleotidase, lipoprotein e(P4) family [Zooshikella ganghwensis]
MACVYSMRSCLFWMMLVSLTGLAITGCATSVSTTTDKPRLAQQSVLSTLWMDRAGEYRALCHQAFNMAKLQVDRRLSYHRTLEKPLAVIVDIDETVLSNVPYFSQLIDKGEVFPSGWKVWMQMSTAQAIPGALEFLKYARFRGVEVFYISNRSMNEGLTATINNLVKMDFPFADQRHLLLKSTSGNKQPRRDRVEQTHEVILLIGDNLNDFSLIFSDKPVVQRNNAVDMMSSEFGKRFIILPNPIYGDWEGALYDYQWGTSSAQKLKVRQQLYSQ